jgi:enoyl-CoA hydratase/carnithine racemase
LPSDTILYQSKDRIAVITLNRPEKLNAMNPDMWGALEATWQRFINSDDRVAILTGAGDKAFCVGADLESDSLEVWRSIPGCIVDIDKPVISAVFGHCLGGGLGLVQHSDICIAADDTLFAFPEARVGLAIGGASSLVLRIPQKIAMELMLTGNKIDARRAYEVGLVNKVVPRAQLMDTAMEYATRIAANAPLVLAMLKTYARATMPKGPTELSAVHRREAESILASQDAKEGVEAFRRKRRPKFLGM